MIKSAVSSVATSFTVQIHTRNNKFKNNLLLNFVLFGKMMDSLLSG